MPGVASYGNDWRSRDEGMGAGAANRGTGAQTQREVFAFLGVWVYHPPIREPNRGFGSCNARSRRPL